MLLFFGGESGGGFVTRIRILVLWGILGTPILENALISPQRTLNPKP